MLGVASLSPSLSSTNVDILACIEAIRINSSAVVAMILLIPSNSGESSSLVGSHQGASCMLGSGLLRRALAMLDAAQSLQLLPHLQACCTSALKVRCILWRHSVPECVWLPQDLQRNDPNIMVLNNKHHRRIMHPAREAEVGACAEQGQGIGLAAHRHMGWGSCDGAARAL